MLKPRLLADENIPRTVIITLREKGYDVVSVWELKPGMSDERSSRVGHKGVENYNNV